MRLDGATMIFEPRSVGAAIDLAILYYRQQAARLVALSLMFGTLPTAVSAWRAHSSGDGWLWAGLSFFFLSPFLGAAVVAGAGHHVFGEDFTLRNALKQLANRGASLLLFLPLARLILGALGVMCWGILWVPLAARYGYISEVLLLERLNGLQVGKRLEGIVRNYFFEACGRYLAIVGFISCLALALFFFFDLLCQILFGYPIFLGKVSWAVIFDDVTNLLSYDPVLVATWIGTWWLVYPLARLAWFFCYLDNRIRKEGWDVELDFRVEAQRLQATG